MKTTKSLVWATLAVMALTFASTALAEHGTGGPRTVGNGTGSGDGLGWLRNTLRGAAAAIADLLPRTGNDSRANAPVSKPAATVDRQSINDQVGQAGFEPATKGL